MAGARDQFADLLPISEYHGPEDDRTLTTPHELACWTGKAGNAPAARDQHAALLPIYEGVLGPEHPDTLAARHKFAHYGEGGRCGGGPGSVRRPRAGH